MIIMYICFVGGPMAWLVSRVVEGGGVLWAGATEGSVAWEPGMELGRRRGKTAVTAGLTK